MVGRYPNRTLGRSVLLLFSHIDLQDVTDDSTVTGEDQGGEDAGEGERSCNHETTVQD